MPEDNNLNHTLSQVRYVAEYLDDATLQFEDVLHEMNKHYWGLDDDMKGMCFGQ